MKMALKSAILLFIASICLPATTQSATSTAAYTINIPVTPPTGTLSIPAQTIPITIQTGTSPITGAITIPAQSIPQ